MYISDLGNIKLLKLATMFMGLASIAKVIISLFYLVRCIISGNVILLFYVGEILIWSA